MREVYGWHVPAKMKPKALTIPELIAELQALDALDSIERAKAAKAKQELPKLARATIAAAGDEGIWQAKRRGMTYKEIMAEMSYSDDGPVGRAISRHNKRRSGQL